LRAVSTPLDATRLTGDVLAHASRPARGASDDDPDLK
jgi:hypothetical protein